MELMIAVVVAGILASVAYPSFMSLIARGRRADAIAVLTSVVQGQERWRSNRNAYASSFGDDGLKMGASGSTIATISKYYDFSLTGAGAEPSFSKGYIVTATPKSGSPQSKDKGCQVLTVSLEGSIFKYLSADSAGTDTTETANCWSR
jgi:type IV pilus assembly protein PilE